MRLWPMVRAVKKATTWNSNRNKPAAVKKEASGKVSRFFFTYKHKNRLIRPTHSDLRVESHKPISGYIFVLISPSENLISIFFVLFLPIFPFLQAEIMRKACWSIQHFYGVKI
jgi:hypothetical protein